MTIHETLAPAIVAPILDHLPDAVFWLQPVLGHDGSIADFVFTYANRQGRTFTSQSTEVITGRRLLRDGTLPGDAGTKLFPLCIQTLRTAQQGNLTLSRAGQSFDVACTAYEGGVLLSLHALPAADTTREEHNTLRSLKWMVENAPIGMVLYDAVRNELGAITDFRVRHYNQRSNELLGITEEQRKNWGFKQVLEMLGIPNVFEYYIEIVETGLILQKEQYIANIGRWLFVSTVKLDDGFVVMHTDVTELKQSQKALEAHTEYLNSILNTSLNAVVVMEADYDADGQISDFIYRQVNPAFTHWAATSEEALLGKGMVALFPHTVEAGIFQVYHDVIRSGKPRHVELAINMPERRSWLDLRIAPLGNNRAVANFTDITPRKEAFAQVEQQKNLLDNILKYSSNGIAVSEMIRDSSGKIVDGRTLVANEAASRFIGLPLDVYLTKRATELDPRLLETEYYKACIHTLETGEPILTRYYFAQMNRWLELSVSRMDANRLIHIFTDVTPAKQAELQMADSAGKLKAVFNAAQAGMFTFAPEFDAAGTLIDFRFVMVNPTIAAYVGEQPERLEGALGSTWFPGYLTNGVFDMYRQTYLTGEPSRRDILYDVDGHNNYLDLQCVKVGEHLLISFTDHTALRQVQAQLERTVEDLKKMNVNLEQFAYSASHDLKEPLRKINFFAERLRERMQEKLNAEEADLLERMEKACHRMNTLIDDLLEYSRVSRGAHQLEAVDLGEVLRTVLENLELNIQEKGAIVGVSPLPQLQGHRQQLQQLFQNLLENALKYRHPNRTPQIAVAGRMVRGNDAALPAPLVAPNGHYLLLEVSDNGIGFEQEDAERIFQVFTRLHGRSEYAGTGVGLSIARKVVENHGGQIWAQAKPDAGARFFVLLPV